MLLGFKVLVNRPHWNKPRIFFSEKFREPFFLPTFTLKRSKIIKKIIGKLQNVLNLQIFYYIWSWRYEKRACARTTKRWHCMGDGAGDCTFASVRQQHGCVVGEDRSNRVRRAGAASVLHELSVGKDVIRAGATHQGFGRPYM